MNAFPKITAIPYEGPDSRNPLAYRWYDADAQIEGKSMRDHLRFAVVFWHTMRGGGSDPFGLPTMVRPWEDGSEGVATALKRARVFFEFCRKLGIPYWTFHDRDVAPEGRSLAESNRNLDRVAKELAKLQADAGMVPLWGTANLFSHPRYAQGAATSPSAEVFAFAAGQVKHALETTHALGGLGYVFWGGREGYATLLNTDLKREIDHLGRFLHLAVEHKKKVGFGGQFYIEPKPREPTKHQYDSDAAACLNFLREYGLLEHFQLNIETNHATLAGHTMQHELEVAGAAGALGSIDANMGDTLLGWDTDQFPTDLYLTTQVMLTVLKYGGFKTGGTNFDAKVRRESHEPVDLFHAHIAGIDAFARGLRAAARIRADGRLAAFLKERYASWDGPLGRRIESGKTSLEELSRHALAAKKVARPSSGRQELLEDIFNQLL